MLAVGMNGKGGPGNSKNSKGGGQWATRSESAGVINGRWLAYSKGSMKSRGNDVPSFLRPIDPGSVDRLKLYAKLH
jgi:hypothetical protein